MTPNIYRNNTIAAVLVLVNTIVPQTALVTNGVAEDYKQIISEQSTKHLLHEEYVILL